MQSNGSAQKRILILSLSSGEGDLPMHRASVSAQKGCKVEHVEFAGLPNLEAHRTLYSKIMEEADRFDAFIKLDGDMVFREPFAAQRMASALQGDIDMVSFPVFDFITAGPITGIHVFSPRCVWSINDISEPRVDPKPSFPGRSVSRRMRSWAPALHAHFMTREQAFAFGLHRGYKAFRRRPETQTVDRWMGAPHPLQIQVLRSVWKGFLRSKDPVRGAVLVGAERVRRVALDIEPFAYKDTTAFDDVKRLALEGEFSEIRDYCAPYWRVWPTLWDLVFQVRFAPGILLRRARR